MDSAVRKSSPFWNQEEKLKPEISPIIGKVPGWVQGSMIRTAPAKWDFPDFTMTHMVDGYTMICKFEFEGGENGTVAFSSKFLQSQAYKKAVTEQKPVYAEYSTRPAASDSKKSFLSRIVSSIIPDQTDNCQFICTSGMCRNPVVLADTGFMFELDPKTLEYFSRHDPVKEIGVHCLSAHPLTDPETGATYNVGISMFSGAKWSIIKFPSGCNELPLKESIKKVQIEATFPCRNKTSMSWFHSFGMCKNFIVFIEQPSLFNVTKLIGRGSACPRDLHDWKPEQKNRFYIYHKKTTKFIRTEILSNNAFFYYHVLNCYEQEGHIVVDLFGMASFDFIDAQELANLRAGRRAEDKDSPHLLRFIIPAKIFDLKSCPLRKNLVTLEHSMATAIRIENKVILEPEQLSQSVIDFATFDKKIHGPCLRYIWGTGFYGPSNHQHKIVKFDLKTREEILWHAEQHQAAGEPLFVRNPDGKTEDDGVVVVAVTNYIQKEGEKDFVVFLDAKTLNELARANFQTNIPVAIHSVLVNK